MVVDGADEGLDQVFHMDEGLAVRNMANKQFTGDVPSLNPFNLMRERNGMTGIVIHPGNPQDDRGNGPPLRVDHAVRSQPSIAGRASGDRAAILH